VLLSINLQLVMMADEIKYFCPLQNLIKNYYNNRFTALDFFQDYAGEPVSYMQIADKKVVL